MAESPMTEPRNVPEADINPHAAAFQRAKLRMLEEERAFEDWWTSTGHGSGVGVYTDLAKAALATHRSFARLGWMARVREVDRLRDALARVDATLAHSLEMSYGVAEAEAREIIRRAVND